MGLAGKSLAKDGKALKAISQGNVNVKPAAVSNSTAASNSMAGGTGRFKMDLQMFAKKSGNNKKIIVTEDVIRNAMKDAPLRTQQKSVSIPVIQNYVDRVLLGETNLPKIKVDGDIIVDGNHRYITSRITGIDVDIQDWIGGNPDKVISWADIILDSFDWGNR